MQERALSAEAMVAAPASPKSLCRRSRRVNEAVSMHHVRGVYARGLGASTKLSPLPRPTHTPIRQSSSLSARHMTRACAPEGGRRGGH
jgi:hypothetical protein